MGSQLQYNALEHFGEYFGVGRGRFLELRPDILIIIGGVLKKSADFGISTPAHFYRFYRP